jgi:hypothetical protein
MSEEMTVDEKRLSDSTYSVLESFVARHGLNGAVVIAVKGTLASQSIRMKIEDVPMLHDVLKRLVVACETMMAEQGLESMEGKPIREHCQLFKIVKANPENN